MYPRLPVDKIGMGRNASAAESDGEFFFAVMILGLGGFGGSSSLITPPGFSI